MKTKYYRSNINCNGCQKKVEPFLQTVSGLTSWQVDLQNPKKILTATGDFDEKELIEKVEAAGFLLSEVSDPNQPQS